ncbi:MAG TPA: hypothetical protein VMG12_19300 [Polyangiaceae bacterium]|nr:hypothetical protein [Polyangiaceae bacterium]
MSTGAPATPALWPLAIVAVAAGVGAYVWWRPSAGVGRTDVASAPAVASSAPPLAAPSPTGNDCPASQLADDGVCVPVPPPEDTSPVASAPIELLPGRTPDFARYVTPIANYPAAAAPEGLGLLVAAPRGVPVTAVSLEAQSGQTRRWVTATVPPRLLTLHRVERSGSTRTYVVAYAGVAFDTTPGIAEVAVGTPLGRVAAGPGITGLTLHVRQLRRGVEPENVAPERLLLDSSSLACDPRNVLPLEPAH